MRAAGIFQFKAAGRGWAALGRRVARQNHSEKDGGDLEELKKLIREVPDYPKPGILFYDITTLLKDPVGLHKAVDALADHYVGRKIDCVVGIEARGFIFAPMVAYRLNAGFVPVRKPRKLPAAVAKASYDLEYGQDSLEVHRDAVSQGSAVLIIDDLLATGGTAAAVAGLVESLGGQVAGLGFLIELEFLKGRDKLQHYELHSVLRY
jgi:adenine phosphoribosyltransferase